MKVLDLYCGQGGTAMGYSWAGFEVVGVDNEPQPNFPFRFFLDDALKFCKKYYTYFDLLHASPPCQHYSKSTIPWTGLYTYPDLIGELREVLRSTGKYYVIENVPGSPLIEPIFLNGAMFGLFVHRPRFFECNFTVKQLKMPKVPRPVEMGRPVKQGDYIQPVGHFSGVQYAREQMEIPWMGQAGLSQAIPPAYTKYVGEQYLEFLSRRKENGT